MLFLLAFQGQSIHDETELAFSIALTRHISDLTASREMTRHPHRQGILPDTHTPPEAKEGNRQIPDSW